MAKSKKSSVNKSAVSGRFVSNRQVARSPNTTFRQTIKKKPK